jgi:predicted nucleic acid-binding protein
VKPFLDTNIFVYAQEERARRALRDAQRDEFARVPGLRVEDWAT